jgi:hypothetical protein
MIPKSTFDAAIAGIALLGFVLVAVLGVARHPVEATTWPPDGPLEIFGVSELPELPESAPCPVCPDYSFLARFVGALDDANATPREIRDVLHRSYIESRYNAGVVSSTGDYGICQINQKAHPETDVERLLTDPEYAAGECLRVYRVFYKACGAEWQCCYRYGIRGCKGRVTATNKRRKK